MDAQYLSFVFMDDIGNSICVNCNRSLHNCAVKKTLSTLGQTISIKFILKYTKVVI